MSGGVFNNPAIVITGGPTGNLDSKSGDEIMELLHKLNKGRGAKLDIVIREPEVAQRTQGVIYTREGRVEVEK